MGKEKKEFSEEYRRGFEDAMTGALICAGNMRYNGSVEWVLKGFAETVESMTPEKHAEWLKAFERLNHRPYTREKYEMIIGGRR